MAADPDGLRHVAEEAPFLPGGGIDGREDAVVGVADKDERHKPERDGRQRGPGAGPRDSFH